jgi:hypothetical protein
MNLTLDDLIGKCPDCAGTGEQPQRGVSAGGNTFGQRPVQVFGDFRCNRCMGEGRWGLTETGRTLVKFLDVVSKLKEYGRLDIHSE